MLISLKFPRASYMPFPKTETMSNLWDFFTSWVLEHRLFTLPALASWVLLWPKFWIALCSSWHTALPVAIPSHPPNPPMLPSPQPQTHYNSLVSWRGGREASLAFLHLELLLSYGKPRAPPASTAQPGSACPGVLFVSERGCSINPL